MKKIVFGILIGLLIGAGVTRLALRLPPSAPAKTAEPAAAAPEKENPLRLSPAKRTAAGIALAKPTETSLVSEVPAFGRVLDLAPLVTLAGEVEIARTAQAASEKEMDRAKKMFAAGGNASAQTVETAEANAARDRAVLASAQARLAANWGREIAGNLESLTQAFAGGAALARLDLLPGEMPDPAAKTAHLNLPGAAGVIDADVIGRAPTADPQMPGASFLVLVRGHPLPAGAALRGTLPGTGATTTGLVVPRSAIVYHQGSAWAFVLGEEDTFERKLVSLGRSVGDDTVAITQGLEADEHVVTAGAQQLLAAELQAGGAPEE